MPWRPSPCGPSLPTRSFRLPSVCLQSFILHPDPTIRPTYLAVTFLINSEADTAKTDHQNAGAAAISSLVRNRSTITPRALTAPATFAPQLGTRLAAFSDHTNELPQQGPTSPPATRPWNPREEQDWKGSPSGCAGNTFFPRLSVGVDSLWMFWEDIRGGELSFGGYIIVSVNL